VIEGFATNKITLGNLGGFHILKNIDYSDQANFHRLIIETDLNRSTASPENINIPYVTIAETGAASLNNAPGPSSPYQIKIVLSDTTVQDIPKDRALTIFANGATGDTTEVISEVRVHENSDDTTEISLLLNKNVEFRATADNAGTIVLDVLK